MRHSIRRGGRAATLGVLAGLAAGHAAFGQQTFSTYVGPDNGSWGTPGHWDNLIVPNGAGSVALVPGPRIVVLPFSVLVDKYGVGGVIRVSNGVILGVQTQTDNLGVTGIFGGGTTSLESVGSGTYLRLYGAPGSFAIHGNSGNPTVIQLSNSTANVIDGSNADIIFYNEGTIRGSGNVGNNSLMISNSGSIIAQYPGNSLTIDPSAGGVTNSGTLMSQGGALVLANGVFTNTGVGSINIQGGTGGTVSLTSARVVGGVLQGTVIPGEAFFCLNNSVLQDVRIAGEVRVPNGHVLYLDHGLEITGGALFLDSVGTGTFLRVLSDATLFGVTGVEMSNSSANVIDAQSNGLTLTNNSPAGIRGSGSLCSNSLNVINNTNIYASGSAGLYIDPVDATPFVNHGSLYSLAGSTLVLQNGTFDSLGSGHIIVQPGAACVTSGATLLGGSLQSAQPNGIFSFQNNSVIDSVSMTAPTIASIPNGHLCYLRNSLVNQGTFNLESVGSGTFLRALTNCSISGGGVIACSNTQTNVFDAYASGLVLTLQNQTIRGSCSLGSNSLAVVNNSLIEAQGSSGIVIDSPDATPFDNNATVRALTGSYVNILSSTFDNSTGLIEVQDGASGYLTASTLIGGTVRTLGSGQFTLQNNAAVANPTFDTGCQSFIPNGHLAYAVGASVVNRGTFTLSSVGSGTYFRVNTPTVTFSGGGVIACSNTTTNVFDAQSSGNTLVLQDQTLRGACSLGWNSLAVVNNSLIEAQGSSGIIIDSPDAFPFENNATVRALNGSSVSIVSSTFDNSHGLLEVQDNAIAYLSGSTIHGGHVRTLGSGLVSLVNNSAFYDLTIDAGSVVGIANGHLAYAFADADTIHGTFTMNSVGSGTYLRFNSASVTLSGSGGIACSDTTTNVFDAQTTGNLLTLQGVTLRGACQLGTNSLAVLNNGVVLADAGNPIIIDPPAASGGFTNGPSGLLWAQGPGGITIHAGPFSTGGAVQVDPSRVITRTSDDWVQTGGAVLCNGQINLVSGQYLLQSGELSGGGLVHGNVSNTGGTVSPGQSHGLLTIDGTYSQAAGGSLRIEVGGPVAGTGFDRLVVTGSANLAGTLTASTIDGFRPNIGDSFDVLTANARLGTFSDIQAPEFAVSYTATAVRLTYTGTPCDPDYNQDGNADQDDVLYLVNAISGGGNPSNRDLDFNVDGNADQDDVLSLVNFIAGGGCP